MPAKIKLSEIIGKRYGRLVAIKEIDREHRRDRMFLCKCDCGNETKVSLSGLRSKTRGTKSCGCLQKEKAASRLLKHGFNKRNEETHRLYGIWSSMKTRCNNPNRRSYGYYGGRGIQVCDEWEDSFEAFYMGDG